jgi:hypothetical protein
VRFQDDILAIWVRTADNANAIQAITAIARRVLDLPASALSKDWEFKPHNASAAHNSSTASNAGASAPATSASSAATARLSPVSGISTRYQHT